MASSPRETSSTKKGHERCAAHGLVFDAATQPGCVLCRKSLVPEQRRQMFPRAIASIAVVLVLTSGVAVWLVARGVRDEPSALLQAPTAAGATMASAGDPHAAMRRGPVKLTLPLARRAPLSSLAEVQRRIGYADADVSEPDEDYQAGAESFDLFVPASCRDEQPAGLLVWIDAADVPVLPAEYEAVLERQRVLWAGARKSGNRRKPPVRVNLALDIVSEVQSRYRVDVRRVLVGGFSGGARSATKAALLYPDVFAGGLFVGAADYVRKVGPDPAGRLWPSSMPRPDPQRVAASKLHRFALVVGENDPNRDFMLQVHRDYLRDGFRGATIALVPEMGHWLPSAELFSAILARLAGG